MLYLPDDTATCALAVILMNYHSGNTMYLRYPKPVNPDWVRTPAQEACRELAARIRSGR